ncbi:TniQ family protein [Nonomuraea sp. NEAU-L178]|nr:TniQ family protein [Nonomuraea aurantiaca]
MSNERFVKPSRLPLVCRPFHRETTQSYITRLASANRLAPGGLQRYLSASDRSIFPTSPERLSAVTGISQANLLLALPDLEQRYPKEPLRHQRRACVSCQRIRGSTEPITCWLPQEQMACVQHFRWLEAGKAREQPSLVGQSSIVRANAQHRRLVRRLGRHDMELGYEIATRIVVEWHRKRWFDEDFQRLMTVFRSDWRSIWLNDPYARASRYPQVIALTRLIATPHWRSLAIHDEGRGRFFDELVRTVAPSYLYQPQQWSSVDPLLRWIGDEIEFAVDPQEIRRRRTHHLARPAPLTSLPAHPEVIARQMLGQLPPSLLLLPAGYTPTPCPACSRARSWNPTPPSVPSQFKSRPF